MINKAAVMRWVLIVCAAPWLSSCAAAPKTVGEFRAAMSQGPAFTKQEAHDINREFSLVVKDVERKSKECLNFGYNRTQSTGIGTHHTTTIVYHPRVRMAGEGKAEMFLQMEHIPKAIGSPDGGAYIFLTDIKKTSPSKTHMNMYGPSFPTWRPIFNAVKGWGEGKNVKCPGVP